MQTAKKTLYLFALFMVLYEFTTYAANDMIMPGMIKVISEFHVGANYIALSLICYILGNALLTLLIGPLSERYGNRRVILIGAIFFVFATFAMVLTKNINQFLLIRIVEGIGLSVIAAGYALIHKNFNDEGAVKLTALMGNVAILAPLIGPMIGAAIVSHFNWRVVFYLIVTLALIAVFGLFKYIPQCIVEKKSHALSLRRSLVEYIKVLRNKNFIIGLTICTFSAIAFVEWIGFSPAIILYKLHKGYLTYTMYQLVAIGGISIGSISMQFIGGRIKFYKILQIGLFCAIGAILINLGVFFVTFKLDFVSIGFFVFGLGGSLVSGVVMRMVMSDKSISGNYAMSAFIFVQMLLMMMALSIMTHIVHTFDYSLDCLSFLNILSWVCYSYFLIKFIRLHKNREWE